MIILRMFSKKESDKKKSSALGASLGIAGVGTGGAFLGKHLLDKKEKKTNKKNLEGIESKFKADQRGSRCTGIATKHRFFNGHLIAL